MIQILFAIYLFCDWAGCTTTPERALRDPDLYRSGYCSGCADQIPVVADGIENGIKWAWGNGLMIPIADNNALPWSINSGIVSNLQPWPEKPMTERLVTIREIYHCGLLKGVALGLSASSVKDGLPEKFMAEWLNLGCASIKEPK